jgi:salicylate hydroxylase
MRDNSDGRMRGDANLPVAVVGAASGVTVGRVAQQGNPAHPKMPFFAPGATQAIEDAAVVAGCLGQATRGTVEGALRRYESLRKERASRVQMLSRARREHHHLPDGEEQRKRDAEFAQEDPLGHNDWLYGHDAEHELAGASVASAGAEKSSAGTAEASR